MSALEEVMRQLIAAPPEILEQVSHLLQGQNRPREPYLTMRELARRLGFAESSLRRWRVPGHDLGGCIRYRANEVDDYLRTQEHARRQAALRAERRLRRAARAGLQRPVAQPGGANTPTRAPSTGAMPDSRFCLASSPQNAAFTP